VFNQTLPRVCLHTRGSPACRPASFYLVVQTWFRRKCFYQRSTFFVGIYIFSTVRRSFTVLKNGKEKLK